jgi:hypothetical protein
MTHHQRRHFGVAIDDGSLAATLVSPLKRREKINIKNTKVISGDINVAAIEPSSAATLWSRR